MIGHSICFLDDCRVMLERCLANRSYIIIIKVLVDPYSNFLDWFHSSGQLGNAK